MSHSPVGGVPFHSLGGGLLSYEDTGHGGGMPHIQDLSSPSEGHLIQGDSDSEYNDDYAQQLDDAAANDESDEENSDGGDAQPAESEEEEDEAENDEASEPDSENDDDAGDEDDEDASDPQQAEQAGMGAGANNFRRARSAMNRRGRQVTQRSETSADQEDDDDDLSYAMRLQRQINNTSGNRRRSTRAAAQKRPVYADSMDDASENEDDSEDGEETVQRADREVNGVRSRPSRRAASAALEAMQQKPKVARKGKKKVAGRAVRGAAEPRKPSRSTRTSNHAIQRPKYAESSEESSDSASETEKQEKREALQKEMVSGPCKANGYYISPYPEDLDDEVERVLGHRDMEDIELDPVNPWTTREFHIKWKRYAYIHSSWDTLATLQQLPGIKRVQNYMRRVDELAKQTSYLSPEELELINVERQMQEQLVEDHMMVERIIEEFVEGDETKYLVKWGGLPYMENTWELKEAVLQAQNGEQAIDEYQERESRVLETSKTVEGQRKSFLMKGHRALTVQPKFLAGGELRDYQLNGLNWLVYSWLQDNNVILADEMGLGKTIQCVSFCAYLAQTLSIMGPFLVIVPLSTVHNWVKEFAKWAPQVNTVVYVGDTVSRGVARRYEFETNRRTGRQHRFEVMITTFEVVLKDAPILNKIKWNFMLMDEAHRLKNHESALYQELMTWHFKNKLLVTGTPLQNSIQELWALLHFLEPQKFDSMEGFIEAHSLDTDEGVRSLHAELSPHLLRRVIKDVEKSLPPKNERILRVEMTPLQKQYYKWILNRNFEALNKGARGSGHVSLLNIITELKKTCNHPFLFESAEESYRGRDDENAVDRLVTTSGKMVILDKLMQRLKATGHRVLIFSQMVRVLDIISDYLRLRGYCHQRLDGSTSPIARQQAMSHFNAEGSPDFAFLLSTRAGGLGINLATADTVIIFDSDWNPQNDLQAMSRAHRIGQKDTVNIYRFVTSGSVEENILERAKQKMVLDHVVIQRMDTSGRMVLDPRSSNQSAKMFDKEELSAILRFGAEKLFKTGGGAGEEESTAQEEEEEAQALYEESIDDILARAEKVETSTTAAAEGGANELLNQFNYATFKNEEDDATFWSRLIPVEKRIEEKEEELLPRQARLKVERGDLAEDEPESPKSKRRERREGRGPVKSKVMQAGPPLENCHRRVEEVVARCEEEATTVSLNKKEALAFVRAVRKFGTTERMEDIVAESGPHVAEELDSAVHTALYNALLDGCRDAVKVAEEVRAREVKEEPPPTSEGSKPEKKVDPQLDFFGVCVKAADLVTIVEKLDMMHKKLRLYSERPGQYRLETASQLSAPKWGSLMGWTPRDDAMLLMGVHRHGLGNWEKVINDPVLGLEEKLGAKRAEEAGDSGKLPKGSHLETRALGLLKKMEALMRKPPKAPAARPDKATRRPIHSKAAARLKRESSVSESDLKGSAARRPPGAGRPKAKPPGSGRGGKVVDPQQALDEVRVTMKKLRTLQRHKDIPKDQAIAKTKKYLKEVGKHIDDVTGGHSQEKLWNWVAKFTENPLPGERMMNLYRRLAGLDAPAGGSRGGGSGEDRRERSSEPVGTSHRPGDAINKRAAVGDGGRGGEAAHHNHHHQQHKRQRMERTHSAETSEIAHAERHRGREHDRDRQRDDRQQADRERSRNFDNGLQREGSMATGASGTLQGSGSGTISRRAPVR